MAHQLRDYELFNVDIKAAYLSSKMDVELYMHEPPGHETVDSGGKTGGTVLKLIKALYGAIKQSAALFRKRLHVWLVDYGFTPTIHDDCVYALRPCLVEGSCSWAFSWTTSWVAHQA